ncbi:hypothetical protein J5U21_02350 [Saccharolobus shibatae]|uniref:Uncharacterized protein n=1 Tax=Saccharolobus shibatae TaxID=2286 RepID=A0A8F5GX28_9CREN|nr:hypothetical protein J5U21_02350 [Saccharolobus shibatae]
MMTFLLLKVLPLMGKSKSVNVKTKLELATFLFD